MEDREAHLSPEEMVAVSEVQHYPFMGANGVPQHSSHSQNRRILEETREQRDKEKLRGGRKDIAEVHRSKIDSGSRKEENKQTEQNQQVS